MNAPGERITAFDLRSAGVDTVDAACLGLLALAGGALCAFNGGAISFGLAGLGLVAGLASPRSAVAAIAAAVPFIARPVAVGHGAFSLLELSILIATISVVCRLLVSVTSARSLSVVIRLLYPLPTTLVAILLLAAGAASLFTVADPRYRPDSIREFRWVIVEPVIAFGLVRWMVRTGAGRRLLLIALIGMATAVSLAGVVQLTTQNGVVVADGVARATGPYRHPNNLALYLDRMSVLALAFAVSGRFRRRAVIAATVICGLGLAATLSRGALVAYVAGAMWVVGATRIRHGRRWIIAGAIAVTVVIALLGSGRLTDTGAEGTTSSRVLIWRASVEMIKDHPWTGVGLDQFLNQYGRRYVEPAGWPERYTSHPHNIVLDVWLRLGVGGLIAFACLAGTVAWRVRHGPRDEVNRAVWIGAAGALVAGVVHGFVDNGFFLPDLAVLTWMMIALLESSIAGQRDWWRGADG